MLPHLAEINLLGTGGGYGESIVVHIGNNEWIVIDSCQDPYSKESLPLKFLKSRSVNLSNVKLIVCTHWDDDHIRGISELLNNAPNATFSFARVNDLTKFLQLVRIDYEKLKKIASNSSTTEFNKCLEILQKKKSIRKFAEADKLLYTTQYKDSKIEVYSLSPSDLSSHIFDLEISTLMKEYSALNKKLIKQSPNDRSVVMLLKLGRHNVLLGADLEVSKNSELGWLHIINKSQVIKGTEKSTYFKIPHHGSENGYHEEIWSELLFEKPIATITPWNKKEKLPKKDMLNRYNILSKELYITSPTLVSSKPKKRDKNIDKIIKQFNSSVRELKFQYGVVSSSIDISDAQSSWNTILSGTSIAHH